MWWRSSVWSPRRVPCRNGWMRAALIVSICSFTEWVSNNLYHIKVSGLLCCNICLIEILEMIFNIKYLTKCWLIGEEGTSSQPAPGLALKCSFGTLNCSVTANSQWWPRGGRGSPPPPPLPPAPSYSLQRIQFRDLGQGCLLLYPVAFWLISTTAVNKFNLLNIILFLIFFCNCWVFRKCSYLNSSSSW